MKIVELRVNHVEHPLGFQSSPLSFSWKVEGMKEIEQSWVRISIWEKEVCIFDSGEDKEANSLDYYVNVTLKPRTRYIWKLVVCTKSNKMMENQSWFETGKINENWAGKWITPETTETSSVILAKEFWVTQPITQGRLYVCGLGVYELYINGMKVGNEYLAPGYHSYDCHLQIQTYDTTSYIKNGKNVMQIWLGEGWFKGRFGFDGGFTNIYGNRLYAIGELHMEFADGSVDAIGTDREWAYIASPITFSNIYDGEIYDANIEMKEMEYSVQETEERMFTNTVNETKEIKEAIEAKEAREAKEMNETVETLGKVIEKAPENCGALTDRYSLPIVEKECMEPIELLITKKGEYIFDFGQNMTGWISFDSMLEKGQKVTFTAAEILQDDCFYHENLRTAKTEFVYISDGVTRHVRPHFTFFGFRYMKVECEKLAYIKNVLAHHLRSDLEENGNIITGNKEVNQLFSNALWSQKDNFLDVPTDCPQRDERMGWTGDAQVFSETACYNMYVPAFFRKYLWDMRAEQVLLDGSVPNVVPRLKEGIVAEHGICPWGDAAVIIPWNVYWYYGSKTMLEEAYPGMAAWVSYQKRKEEVIGGPHVIKDGFHFGDWLALDNEVPGPFGKTDPLYIASSYYYYCSKIVAEAAKVLNREAEAKEYQKLADAILADIQDIYFQNDLCICKTQTASALAIMFDLTPETKKQGQVLRRQIEANNGYLNTGFVGTTMLCSALTKTGHHQIAVDLLLNNDYPSWLYSVQLGATTIWERWNSVLADGTMNEEGMNSLNHYSYGSVVAWIYRDICGIQCKEPGFKIARIEPKPDKRLGFAEGIFNSAMGKYYSKWKYQEDGRIFYHIEVPFNAKAILYLPAGKYTMNDKKINGETEIEVTAGSYEICYCSLRDQ